MAVVSSINMPEMVSLLWFQFQVLYNTSHIQAYHCNTAVLYLSTGHTMQAAASNQSMSSAECIHSTNLNHSSTAFLCSVVWQADE